MTFAYDAKSVGSGAGDPVTIAHTCSASTKLLVVIVADDTQVRIGGVPSYDSVAMTDSGEGVVDCNDLGKVFLEVFYLIGPSTGSEENVSVPNTNTDGLYISVISFEADGTVSKHASNSGEAADADPSIDVTTTYDNGLMVGGLAHDLATGTVVGANYTEIYTVEIPGAKSYSGEYDLDYGSSGGTAVNWTADADDWGLIGLAFEEAGGPDLNVAIVPSDPAYWVPGVKIV